MEIIKVLIDGRLLSIKETGINRYSRELIKSYIKEFGYANVFVLTNHKFDCIEFQEIVTNYKPYNIFHFLFFSFYLKRQKFNIYHSTFYSGTFLKLHDRKVIVTVHDLMYRLVERFFSKWVLINWLAIIYYDIIVFFSIKNADIVVSVSYTTSEDVYKFCKKDSIISSEGLNVLKRVETESSNFISSLGIKPKDYFLYVGNLRSHKNIDFLIRCYSLSNTERTLVLCGNFSYVKLPKCSKKIIATGYVTDQELFELYANSEAFIFPSFYEGFGLPVLEALAHGTKVYSSNKGALAEFSKEFVNYFDPYNEESLTALLNSTDKICLANSNKLTLYLKKYNWEDVMSNLISVIYK